MIDHTCKRCAVERRQFRSESYALANVLSFIFDRFYRVRNSDAKGIQGTGLGLAIVKSMIEQHVGQISAENQPGKGSCFTVTLPLTLPAPPEVVSA